MTKPALSEEMYLDQRMIQLKDLASKKDLNTLKEYSTTEKIVGIWADKKPIYEKSFVGGYNNGVTLLSNVDTMVDVRGQVQISDMNRLMPYFELYAGKNYIGTLQNYQNKITTRFEAGSVATSAYIDITIWYTKTTD